MEHTSEHEGSFVKVFIAVFTALTLFTLFCIFIARGLAPEADAEDSILRAALIERIMPVSGVNTSAKQIDSAPDSSATGTQSAQPGPETSEQLVARACAGCHLAGAAGAPKIDDEADWGKRREAGLDALVASVVNGKGAMPARAGLSLTDEQIMMAVKNLAGLEDADDNANSDAISPADSGSSSEASLVDSSAATMVVAAVDGDLEIGAKAKITADTLCMGCHLSGAAGAPKIGDSADWALRAEGGIDEMVKTVALGRGAMPPRGGSDLNDEELVQAVNYLMNKQP